MSRRQQARQQREAAHFAAKRAAASSAAERAAVAFDHLRARLAHLTPAEREHAWHRVAEDLDAWADHFNKTHAV